MSEGVTMLTRIPSRLTSIAIARANMVIAAIAAPITVSPGVADLAASDATTTIEPAPLARMTGRTARLITRSEEHTSELQSLMRISYAVFCLKKKNNETQLTDI